MSDSSGEGKDSTKSSKKRDGNQDPAKPKKSKSTRDKDAQGSSKGSKPKREGSSSTVVKDRSEKDREADDPRQKSKVITETFRTKAVGLADFQKLKEIGKGAIGKVYVVRMKGTDDLYAMKMIKKYDMVQRNKVKRILTEREILATADHPFIVSLYYSFQSQHSLVFIMEYCAGGEFYRLIQRQPFRCLKEEDARFYAAEVLSALEYLHKMGFIYRDLKPENVLVHASGHLVLTDFDLSKGSSAPVQPKVITKMFTGAHGVVYQPDVVTNSFVGTEEYLAPEVVAGTSHNATVDWWTFGILLYEMLYGTTPFRGTTRDDTFSNIRKTYIDFPEHKRGGVSKECKKILKHLLDRDPHKRLGAVGGATDIKDHAFFEPMKTKWTTLHLLKPPIMPTVPPLVIDEKLQQEDAEEEIDTDKLSKDHLWKDFGNLDLVTEEDPEAVAHAQEKEREKEKDKDRSRKDRSRPSKTRDRDTDSEESEKDREREKERTRKDRLRAPKVKDRDTDSDSEESVEKERPEKRPKKDIGEDDDDEKKVTTPKAEKKKERKDKDNHREDGAKDDKERKEKKEKRAEREKADKDAEKERSSDHKNNDREDEDGKADAKPEPKEKKEKRTDGDKKDKVEKTDSAKKEKREKTDAERQEKKEKKERKEREDKAD